MTAALRTQGDDGRSQCFLMEEEPKYGPRRHSGLRLPLIANRSPSSVLARAPVVDPQLFVRFMVSVINRRRRINRSGWQIPGLHNEQLRQAELMSRLDTEISMRLSGALDGVRIDKLRINKGNVVLIPPVTTFECQGGLRITS
jgi:hypothetical protein